MQNKLNTLIKSRRFWASVSGLIVVVLNETGIANLNPDTVQNTILLIIGWVASESIRSSEGGENK